MKNSARQRPRTQQKSESLFGSINEQLPLLTDFTSLKHPTEAQSSLYTRLVNQIQLLEKTLQTKQKSIQQLEFMLATTQIALQSRDKMIQELRQQNLQLRDKNMELVESAKKSSGLTMSQSRMSSRRFKNSTAEFTETPSKVDTNSKRLMRARTKENNFDDSLKSIIDQDFDSMQQYVQKYYDLPHLNSIKTLIQGEEQFLNLLQNLDFSGTVHLFDAIQLTLQEHKHLFMSIIKSRKLIECSMALNDVEIPINLQNKSQSEYLRDINRLLCDALDCDKVSVFILDGEKNELWTKNYKNDQITRINVNDDITGVCFKQKEVINVNNAYNDMRFNKDYDIQNSYKTVTLLLCPILDTRSSTCIGVIQAFNKQNTIFNVDDISFMQGLSQILSAIIRSQQQQDEAVQIQNAFRSLFRISLDFMKKEKAKDILRDAEEQLGTLFHVSQARVYFVRGNELIRINEKNQLEKHDSSIGLVGLAIQTKEMLFIQNLYNHSSFNKQVDIETSMPILCHPIVRNSEVYLVLQVINQKSIRIVTVMYRYQNKHKSLDSEILENFGQIVVNLVERTHQLESLQAQSSIQ